MRSISSVLLLAVAVWAEAPKLTLPDVPQPEANPSSPAKVALGRQLFFDKRLSRDNTVACVTCHDPAKGWSNGERFAAGIDRKVGPRGVPSLVNVGYNQRFHWDGVAGSLEEQALLPIQNSLEMDMRLSDLEKKVNSIAGYRTQFQSVFGANASAANIAQALAAYERTIVSKGAPVDRFLAGDKTALSASAQAGFKLFFGEARCHVCHSGPNFTDGLFHNIGIGLTTRPFDAGHEGVSKKAEHRGAFKTPSLREVGRTAPYMHDGSFADLLEVARHYNFGGVTDAENRHRDRELEVLYLSDAQLADLVTFLKEGLSSPTYPKHEPPTLPE